MSKSKKRKDKQQNNFAALIKLWKRLTVIPSVQDGDWIVRAAPLQDDTIAMMSNEDNKQ